MPILEGYTQEPYFIQPSSYQLMVYPVEWIYEGSFNEKLMREHLPTFYIRNWGKMMVVSLPTLIYDEVVGEWFAEDPCQGLKGLLRVKNDLSIFPSDSYAMVQEGRLKFLDTALHIKLGNYTICPLMPVKLEVPRITSLRLGIPFPPEQAIAELKSAMS